jgi:D-alanyl-D-alanine carboxypeptidase/D-alanyl-D-alanine-endopeptidase (penicillin-binding protein 4)
MDFMRPQRFFNLLYVFFFISTVLHPLYAVSGEQLSKIRQLLHNGTVMLNDETGASLVAVNPDRLFMPASIIKVLTSQIALDLLGPQFRFSTECYINSKSDLIVRGYGDPFLVSDEIRILARQLKSKGLDRIGRILLDRSYFADDLSIPGISTTTNPYDALNGALVVNFNTIYVGKDAAGTVFSAEKETPLTPLAIAKAAAFPPGSKERINLSANRDDCAQYAGELLQILFGEQGIRTTDTTIGEASVGSGREPFLTYYNSRQLSEVVQGLLKYSNNFIANQIFLDIGARQEGGPATMQKSKTVFEHYIREKLGIPENQLVMVEGSGISRDNQVTGRAMISIMERFKPNVELLSLKNGHPVKSGTLKGVNNYAGYLKTTKGLRSFVIILNQEKANRDAIMKLLERL